MADPWTWLLGRTSSGAWRHASYQAPEPGQGQDPGQEPRVEVIRRLIAYPQRAFQVVVEAVQAAEEAAHPIHWVCYRDAGSEPTRPYWICFVTSRPGGRRFHVGLELFDRGRLGLWFFSGYDPRTVPEGYRAAFPTRPSVSLPRVELTESLGELPLGRWIQEAFRNQLTFAGAPKPRVPRGDEDPVPDTATGEISETILGVRNNAGPLGLRSARARLAVDLPEAKSAELHALSRLSTLIGRDPRCDLVIDHPNVSSEHLRITWREGIPAVEEQGSKNGTSVSGVPVKPGSPQVLGQEAVLDVGGVPCLFVRDGDEDGPEASPRHQDRIDWLKGKGRLSDPEAEQVLVESKGRGITAGEVLLDRGKLRVAEWNAHRGGGGGCGVGLLMLLLAGLLLSTTGCHSFGLPPLYEQELDPTPMREGSRRIEWDFDVGLRPLFQARGSEETSRIEAHTLFPLGLYEEDPDRSILRLYPFFQHIERTDPDGFEDTDTILFPFVFAGSHPVDGGYFYLFPFGGTLKGLLGKDEAAGVLFPLYGYTRDRDVETHHVLWPLISYTSGGGSSGFRFLPFYGHQEKRRDGQLVFNRTTVLWPFLHWASDATNSRNQFESFFFFPFFGYTRSTWKDDTTVLWPLFRWSEDKQTGYSEVRAPFPFFIYGSGPDHTRFDLWPFFGFRSRGDYERHFFLWPIERYEYIETEEYEDSRLWILPVFWTHHRVYKDGSGADREVTVWPLLRYESRRDGFFEVVFPQPLWFTDVLRNFDTILAPLWTLFRYTVDSEGYEHLNIGLGLYSSRETPQGEHRWDILGGLVGYTSNPGGKKDAEGKLRLFWLLEF